MILKPNKIKLRYTQLCIPIPVSQSVPPPLHSWSPYVYFSTSVCLFLVFLILRWMLQVRYHRLWPLECHPEHAGIIIRQLLVLFAISCWRCFISHLVLIQRWACWSSLVTNLRYQFAYLLKISFNTEIHLITLLKHLLIGNLPINLLKA